MQISIIGDSWGEPNWRFPMPGYSAEGHISQLLHYLGHRVYNSSIRGGTNLSAWESAQGMPAHKESDLVIWFHTEVSRDFRPPQSGWTLDESLAQTSQRVYRDISHIRQELVPRARLWVIEGQAPVYSPHFYQWFKPDYWTRDWRSQILAQPMPLSQLVGPLSSNDQWLAQCRDPIEVQSQWVSDVELIMSSMRASPLFPDQCHPGDLAHKELLVQAQTIIQELSQ